MPAAFGQESFAFHGTALQGTPKRRDRWKRAVDATGGALGEAVGEMYVRKYFPPQDKARIEAMAQNLIAAFDRRIDRLDWMAPKTKAMAKAKLKTLKVHVGYPDRFRDYSSLDVVRGDAYGNAARAELFEYRRNLAKLGRSIDRDEWVMTPQTVNAVNLPVMNAMNFPAAMLQPPYFDPARPLAMDYGAIGAIIGHEISHSFDDQGALFDETGRLHNWWTDADFGHFQDAAERLAKQYDAYEPLPGLHVKGKQTLGENVADVAGLSTAYDGYRLSLAGKPAPVVEGLTGDQQFFVSYAQSWRQKMREPLLRQVIVGDGHAPDEFRAGARTEGPLRPGSGRPPAHWRGARRSPRKAKARATVTSTSSELTTAARAGPTRARPARNARSATTVQTKAMASTGAQAAGVGGRERPPWQSAHPAKARAEIWVKWRAAVSAETRAAKRLQRTM